MARGSTLASLVTMFKAEVGIDLVAGSGDDTLIKVLLSNKQLWLGDEFDWSFLEHRFDLACAVGSRFLALPTAESATGDLGASVGINFNRPHKVETKWGSKWFELGYGIGSKEFNFIDSDQALTLDPIQKWRFASNTSEAASADKVEIWPMPATAQTVRFSGQRQLLALTTNTDKADLDDLLIVLFCAAEWLQKRQSSEAQLKGQLAQSRLVRLRAGYPQRTRRCILGGAEPDIEPRRVVPIITVR